MHSVAITDLEDLSKRESNVKKNIDALRDNRSSPGKENGIKAAGNKCISGF